MRRVAVGTSSEAGAVSVRVSVSAHEDDGLGPLGRCGALLFTHLNSFTLPGYEDTGKQATSSRLFIESMQVIVLQEEVM